MYILVFRWDRNYVSHHSTRMFSSLEELKECEDKMKPHYHSIHGFELVEEESGSLSMKPLYKKRNPPPEVPDSDLPEGYGERHYDVVPLAALATIFILTLVGIAVHLILH